MTDLEKQARDLELKAEKASLQERMLLQPQIDRIVETLTRRGIAVPGNLRRLNIILNDEAMDDMFDNMPV